MSDTFQALYEAEIDNGEQLLKWFLRNFDYPFEVNVDEPFPAGMRARLIHELWTESNQEGSYAKFAQDVAWYGKWKVEEE